MATSNCKAYQTSPEQIEWKSPNNTSRAFFTATKRNEQIWDLRYENGVDVGYTYREVDGFFVFSRGASDNSGGYWEAWQMRAIADVIDLLNEPWEKQIEEEFGDGD